MQAQIRTKDPERTIPQENKCPVCGGALIVCRTERGQMRTIRVHRCTQCGEVFSSLQMWE